MSTPRKALFPANTASAAETRALGTAFGETLQSGNVVALFGTLGAGKTQFAKGICAAFGIEEDAVSSPTFTIVHEYAADVPVYHLDLYRIRTNMEAAALGLEEYLDSEGICLVEWPEVLGDLLPREAIRLVFTHGEGDQRTIAYEDQRS